MRNNRKTWRLGLTGAGLVVAMALGTVATSLPRLGLWPHANPSLAHLARAAVRRHDLSVTMTTGGRVDSSSKTVIECQIERMGVGIQGRGFAAGGASTILSVIPDGSAVKRGDVLCVLDSSDYEELHRAQEMNVFRVRSDHRQAELDVEAARMALGEFREGLMRQTVKTLEGQIALAESELERSRDRVRWVNVMLSKGYLPRSQLSAEEYNVMRSAFDLARNESELKLFQKFSAPIYLRFLDGDVLSAEVFLKYQTHRLRRQEERLKRLGDQVEKCTIRAPHDGVVIYANDTGVNLQIEPGLAVHQKQRLFYLPDLAQMEVEALLHESVAKEVKPGQLARVRIEALSNRALEGHIVSISQLPGAPLSQANPFGQIKSFVGVVKLDAVPRGLLPGMTAEVEIQTARKPDVLTIPAEALTFEEGQGVCYVAHDDQIERREIKVGQASRDLLEVTEGLGEGEEVVLDPASLSPDIEVASGGEPEGEGPDSSASHASATAY
jgi:HlyD family secretion protein